MNVILTRLSIRLQTQRGTNKCWMHASCGHPQKNVLFWLVKWLQSIYLSLRNDTSNWLINLFFWGRVCLSSFFHVNMHGSHQRGTRPGPHVNHSSRGRLFSREIIIVRDIRRRSSLIFFFLPCRAIKWSHSVTENRYRNKLYETICKYKLLV